MAGEWNFRAIVTSTGAVAVSVAVSVAIGSLGLSDMAIAQVVPAADGVATEVDVFENASEIVGGQRSDDGANLFHSFEQFDLGANEIADFIVTPEVENILGRVTGGGASAIDGLIQVTGSDADLFLMNPAGIVFGANAQLDVAGDFTATTASGIEFEAGWFDALASANWGELTGDPIAFDFSDAASGAIANFGELSVSDDSGLHLFGGTAIHSGVLTGGNVRVAAIEGGQTLRLSAAGNVLSLEVAADRVAEAGIAPIALAELLTSDLAIEATELTAIDGVMRLRDTPVGAGDVALVDRGDLIAASEIESRDVAVWATNSVVLGTSGAAFRATGGDVSIVADADSSGAGSVLSLGQGEEAGIFTDGGNARISGRSVDLEGVFSGEYATETGQVFAVAHGGAISIEASDRVSLGAAQSRASERAGDIAIASGGALQVERFVQAASQNEAGDVALTAAGDLSIGENVDSLGNRQGGDVRLESETGNIAVTGSIASQAEDGIAGDVAIVAAGDITIGDLIDSAGPQLGGDVTLTSRAGRVELDSYISSLARVGAAGDIDVRAAGDITVGEFADSSGFEDGSSVTLTSETGRIAIAGALSSQAEGGTAGDVGLSAAGDISVGDSVNSFGDLSGGNITIETATGNVSLDRDLATYSDSGTAGNIAIRAPQGAVRIGSELETYAADTAGRVEIVAAGDIAIGAQFGQFIDEIRREADFDPEQWATVQTYATEAAAEAGDINLRSTGGNIRLDSATYTDDAGQTVTLASVRSNGARRSGDLTLSSPGNLDAGEIVTQAGGGDSGQIAINGNNVTTGNVSSIGVTSSGSIGLSSTGSIVSGDVTTTASEGRSGDISVNSQVDAILGDLRSEGGSGSGNINVEALRNIITGDITSKAIQGDSGSVTLDAGGDITAGDIASVADNGTSGDITIDAGGTVDTGTLTSADGTITVNGEIVGGGDGTSDNNAVNLELEELERRYSQTFLSHLGTTPVFDASVADTEATIAALFADRGIRTASVFIELLPDRVAIRLSEPDRDPLLFYAPVDRDTVLSTIDTYRNHLINARQRLLNRHNTYAAQLYDWLIRPIVPELEARNIDTLMFSVDAGLRSLPFAALYSGERYLVEDYSLSLVPSLGLVDPRYQPMASDAPLLAMGASEFASQSPLPAVPIELDTLVNHRRAGDIVLNEDFTRDNVIARRARTPYPIVHLATHGEFNGGSPDNSYIQLWDTRIGLDEIRELGWHDPALELLVLSACQTALGNTEAEMGFAGLAVAAGVKTAIASLWYVDDAATFMLMSELYHHLANAPIKAEALRSAQLALMRGDVRIEAGMLYAAGVDEAIPIPEELSHVDGRDFSHPYYWSAFTAIGAPW